MGTEIPPFSILSIVVRRWRNRITSIKNESDQWVHDPYDVKRIMVNYFATLFMDDGVHGEYNIPSGVCTEFSNADWDKLNRPYSKCDIDVVVKLKTWPR